MSPRSAAASPKPGLDALFAQLVAAGEPIVPYAQTFEEVWGTFLEDGDARELSKHHRGAPLMVRLSGARHMAEGRSLDVAFLVSRRVERARMEAIVQRIAGVVNGAR